MRRPLRRRLPFLPLAPAAVVALGVLTAAAMLAIGIAQLRSQSDDSAKTQASAVHVRLGEPDAPLEQRLEQVVESSRAAKEAVSQLSSEAMMDYGVVIFAMWELLSRTRMDQFVTPSYNVLVSNVPGPGDEAMYLCGSKMLASYPISAFLPGINLNTTVLSHGNSLDFGLLGDKHVLPDLDLVAQRMLHHFETLQRQVLGGKPAAAKTTGKRTGRKAAPKTRGKTAAKPAPKPRARTAAKRARASTGGK